MENEKNLDFDDETGEGGEGEMDNAPRARNRTVMLTPEITGQVRARLAKDGDAGSVDQLVGDSQRAAGFVSMSGRQDTRGKPALPQPPARQSQGYAAPSSHSASHAAAPQAEAPIRRGVSQGTDDRMQRSPTPPPTRVQEYEEPAVEGDVMEWKKPAPIVAFLVTFDNDENGEVFPLRTGRIIVTSEIPSGGNFLYLNNETVSSMHAIVRISDTAEIQVLDQLSESGTIIRKFETNEEQKLSGDKGMVGHGDELQFGDRKFQVCIMANLKRE